jgi:hypothetical protein
VNFRIVVTLNARDSVSSDVPVLLRNLSTSFNIRFNIIIPSALFRLSSLFVLSDKSPVFLISSSQV